MSLKRTDRGHHDRDAASLPNKQHESTTVSRLRSASGRPSQRRSDFLRTSMVATGGEAHMCASAARSGCAFVYPSPSPIPFYTRTTRLCPSSAMPIFCTQALSRRSGCGVVTSSWSASSCASVQGITLPSSCGFWGRFRALVGGRITGAHTGQLTCCACPANLNNLPRGIGGSEEAHEYCRLI